MKFQYEVSSTVLFVVQKLDKRSKYLNNSYSRVNFIHFRIVFLELIHFSIKTIEQSSENTSTLKIIPIGRHKIKQKLFFFLHFPFHLICFP